MTNVESFDDLYGILKDAYECVLEASNEMKACFENKEGEDMSEEKCCNCKNELKEFYILFEVKEGREEHVSIVAKSADEAVRTFKNGIRILCSIITPLDFTARDVYITRVFTDEV